MHQFLNDTLIGTGVVFLMLLADHIIYKIRHKHTPNKNKKQ